MEIIQSSPISKPTQNEPLWSDTACSAHLETKRTSCKGSRLSEPLLEMMAGLRMDSGYKTISGLNEVNLGTTQDRQSALLKASRSKTFTHGRPILVSPTANHSKRVKPTADLHLPSFKDLGISSANPVYLASSTSKHDHQCQKCQRRHLDERSNLRTSNSSVISRRDSHCCSIRPPPTPPEDATSTDWTSPERAFSKTIYSASLPDNVVSQNSSVERTISSTTRNIELPPPADQDIVAGFSTNSSWLNGAVRTIVSSFSNTQLVQCVEVISQVLPGQSNERRSRPTYEDVLTIVQEDLPSSPFITITHGVTQAMAMEEMPKTPPTTPFATDVAANYFANNQTIFTNAAVVPVYHVVSGQATETVRSKPCQISAPYKTNITILERYIPPTMPQEIEDFFTPSSNRSYLADRLPELALGAGSLLLIYPTKKGGQTFTQKYLGPTLDPLLREFVILNNLTVDAAERLGKMTAVDAMLTFDEMKTRIEALCNSMTQESHPRGRRSTFKVAYSEVKEIILNKESWVNWWVDQEVSRLRQNLVEYHHAGGRMPQLGSERTESTVGMLTRDIIDGVRKSKAAAGSAGIEVGIFVIQRVAT